MLKIKHGFDFYTDTKYPNYLFYSSKDNFEWEFCNLKNKKKISLVVSLSLYAEYKRVKS